MISRILSFIHSWWCTLILDPLLISDLDASVHSSDLFHENPLAPRVERPYTTSVFRLWLTLAHRMAVFTLYWGTYAYLVSLAVLLSTVRDIHRSFFADASASSGRMVILSTVHAFNLVLATLGTIPHLFFLQVQFKHVREAVGLCSLTRRRLSNLANARVNVPVLLLGYDKPVPSFLDCFPALIHTFASPDELTLSVRAWHMAFFGGDATVKPSFGDMLSALLEDRLEFNGIRIRPWATGWWEQLNAIQVYAERVVCSSSAEVSRCFFLDVCARYLRQWIHLVSYFPQ